VSNVLLVPIYLDASVDKTKCEPDSGLTCGEAGLFGRAEWSSPTARKGITLSFKGCGTDTDFFVWHTSSQNRTISSGSLLPVVSMMQPAHPRE
jgi:hypothetical protein